jgi:phenylalanine-4-hydroxylase
MNTPLPYFKPKDHYTWNAFITRQEKVVKEVACGEFVDGLNALDFSKETIPHYSEISSRMHKSTNWTLSPVDGLVEYDKYFYMLSKRELPVNLKIRPYEELDFYTSPAPDIIHEYFGHCPLLMHKEFADFMQAYGQLALQQSPEIQVLFSRIYWFTIEFGLIDTAKGIRIMGAGILPSVAEISSVMKNDDVNKKPFDLIEIAKTSYAVTQKQPIYYILKSLKQLYNILHIDIDYLRNSVYEK